MTEPVTHYAEIDPAELAAYEAEETTPTFLRDVAAEFEKVVHALVRPDNGYCNQCGGHWLYRTDGTWLYSDGEHRDDCVARRRVLAPPTDAMEAGDE